MAKQVVGKAASQVPGGKATPAPPVGTSLGKFGINLGQFVSQFNERTREYNGTPIPVVVTCYSDRSFEFITKSPPASALLKMAAGIASGSAEPHKTKVGKVTGSLALSNITTNDTYTYTLIAEGDEPAAEDHLV